MAAGKERVLFAVNTLECKTLVAMSYLLVGNDGLLTGGGGDVGHYLNDQFVRICRDKVSMVA